MSGNSSHLPINVRRTAAGKSPQQPKLSKPISPCHILYYNARSLLPKLDELRAIADAENPDVICITESWISNEVKNDELAIANYQILRLDRNRHGGGVLLYVHCFFSVNVLPNINPGLELLTVSIESHNPYRKFCIALFYRPPSSSKDIFNSLCNVLHSLDPIVFNNFILIGDFNVNCFLTDSYLYKHLMYCLSPFSFHQIVQSGTHQSSSGNSSLIDLVFVSGTSQMCSCSIISPLANSDHSGIELKFLPVMTTRKPSHQRVIWRYDQGDYQKAAQLINYTDWESLLNADVSLSVLNWQKRFLQIMDDCIPKATIPKRKNLPWLNKNILQCIRKRNSLYKNWKRTGNTITFKKYKMHRNKVLHTLRLGKEKYFLNLKSSNQKSSGKL